MTLSDIFSAVSSSAVIVTLFFLLLQMRQANRNQRALVQQGRVARSSDQLFRLAAPDLTSAYIKGTSGDASISEEDYFRFFLVLTAVARSAEDVFFQHELGLLDTASLANQLASVRAVFATPGGKAAWSSMRRGYDPAFVARMDQIVAAEAFAGPHQAFANWKAELAKSA